MRGRLSDRQTCQTKTFRRADKDTWGCPRWGPPNASKGTGGRREWSPICRERHTPRGKVHRYKAIVKRSQNVNSGSFLSGRWDYRGFLFHILLHVLSGIFHLLCGEHILLLKPKENINVISERESTSAGLRGGTKPPKPQRSSGSADGTHIHTHTCAYTQSSTPACTHMGSHIHTPLHLHTDCHPQAHTASLSLGVCVPSTNSQREIPETSKEGEEWRRRERKGTEGSLETEGQTHTLTPLQPRAGLWRPLTPGS